MLIAQSEMIVQNALSAVVLLGICKIHRQIVV